ncbi:hypothetical protein CDD80_6917 [Ophiocordyceps camponoti-rufipedis]|uniref:Uncharacterized protein n=1 Tax=Ophiocordyceps camponoti-rufipedis TaxID=2004952 RepID=A0A2C5ZFB8_9HYPO|nr:hypothetical protein CDD80_6917 [Ophiocordyceps camponoti-rufipedis]
MTLDSLDLLNLRRHLCTHHSSTSPFHDRLCNSAPSSPACPTRTAEALAFGGVSDNQSLQQAGIPTMATSPRPASTDTYAEPRPSVATTRTGFGSSSQDSRSFRSNSMLQTSSEKRPSWLGHVRRWLSVSEPSAQAMKAQKKMAYKKYGVELDDPRAAAKMHLPIGKVPEGVTTSTTGPSPEKALRMRTQESVAQRPRLEHSRSMSSGMLSVSSRGRQAVAPWVHEQLEACTEGDDGILGKDQAGPNEIGTDPGILRSVGPGCTASRGLEREKSRSTG